MSTQIDDVCANCSDLDLAGVFEERHQMESDFIFVEDHINKGGLISRKNDPAIEWAGEPNETCSFCNFMRDCRALSDETQHHARYTLL